MIFKDLTREITDKMLMEYGNTERTARIRTYEQRYDELIGEVTNEARRQEYWPIRYNEKDEQYKERSKIWVPWADIVCRRLTAVCLSDPIERNFVPLDDKDKELADEANAALELTDEVCDWETLAHSLYYYALGIGEMSIWPEYRAYNTESGQPYQTSGGTKGAVKWQSWFPWFVEPVVLDANVSEPIGAVKVYYWNGTQATSYITQTIASISGVEHVAAQIYLSPIYDRLTGQPTFSGLYRSWKNGAIVDDSANEYGCNPVVTFIGPDPDESGYRGRGYAERFRSLAIEHSGLISTIKDSIDLFPNIWKYSGEEKDANNIVIGRGKVIGIPAEGKFEQAARELNLTEEWNLANTIDSLIHIAAQLPQGFLRDLAGQGKVESGIALKVVFQPIIEAMTAIRSVFGKAERQRMVNTIRILNANNSRKIDLTKLRPEVVYNSDIVPANTTEDIANDLALLAQGVLDLKGLIKKYNPQVTTDEQADAMIKERDAKQQQQSQQRSIFIPSLRQSQETKQAEKQQEEVKK